jgi:imidazolonepropionase-like amidohydrolase
MRAEAAIAALALLAGAAEGQERAAQERAAATQEQVDWTIAAESVYTATGEAIDGGLVATAGGKIRSVAPGKAPKGEHVLRAAAVTPGMIDLSVRITRGAVSVEQSREVTPELSVLDGLDWFDPAWEAQARRGVTAALVNPPDRNVIGGLGAVVKTAGGAAEERLVRAEAVLRGSFGTSPSEGNSPASGSPTDFYKRRPTTRMGVEWEHRQAFYEAAAARRDRERAFTGSDELAAALEGRLPFMVQAWATQDIRTAIYLKEELAAQGLGELRLILDAAAEAWREPELLARSGAAVVLPPFPEGGRTEDGAFMTLSLAKQIDDLGVSFALSAHGSREAERSLARQAGHAIRGGLSFEAALEAVTLAPARMVGVDSRIGSLEPGKDADLVLWNGRPFEATSEVIGVVIGGRLVVDPRQRKGTAPD